MHPPAGAPPPRRRAIARALAPAERRLGVVGLLVLLAACTLAHVVWDVAAGGRGSLLGLTVGPPVVAAGAWLVGRGAQELRARRRGPAGLCLAALAALVAFVGSGALTRGVIFPGARAALPAPGPLDLDGVAADVVAYRADDGVALRGVHARAAGGARAALLYLHGNAESAAQNLELARDLARAGADVLLAEFRGYGGCAGSPTEEGLLLDGRAALRELCARSGVTPGQVVLVGRSLGTGVAAGLAAEGLGRGVLLISPYTSVLDLAAEHVPRPLALLAVRDTFRSRERLALAAQPVVVVHGANDGVIPFAHGAALVAALGARARLVRVDGAGHGDVLARARDVIAREVHALAR